MKFIKVTFDSGLEGVINLANVSRAFPDWGKTIVEYIHSPTEQSDILAMPFKEFLELLEKNGVELG